MFTALGFVAAREPVVHQCVQTGIGHGVNIAAAPAVAAVGAAEFFVFFMTKRDAAIPAVSGDDVNKGFVDKFHKTILKRKAPTCGALQRAW